MPARDCRNVQLSPPEQAESVNRLSWKRHMYERLSSDIVDLNVWLSAYLTEFQRGAAAVGRRQLVDSDLISGMSEFLKVRQRNRLMRY